MPASVPELMLDLFLWYEEKGGEGRERRGRRKKGRRRTVEERITWWR